MVGDEGEDVVEPSLRIDISEPGGLDEGVEDDGALTAAIGAAEQPSLAAKGHTAEGALSRVVGEATAARVGRGQEQIRRDLRRAVRNLTTTGRPHKISDSPRQERICPSTNTKRRTAGSLLIAAES